MARFTHTQFIKAHCFTVLDFQKLYPLHVFWVVLARSGRGASTYRGRVTLYTCFSFFQPPLFASNFQSKCLSMNSFCCSHRISSLSGSMFIRIQLVCSLSKYWTYDFSVTFKDLESVEKALEANKCHSTAHPQFTSNPGTKHARFISWLWLITLIIIGDSFWTHLPH